VVPLNYLLKPEEQQYIIDDCGTDMVLTVRPLVEFAGFEPKCNRVDYLEDLSFKGVPKLRWPKGAAQDDLATLLYTSGTSGRPKGVMLSHGNLIANISQCVRLTHFSLHDRFLGVLPQFHSFGFTVLTMLPLTIGASVVYTARFVPGSIVKLIEKHRPTVFVGIPSMYNALLRAKSATPDTFSSVRFLVSGGEPLPDSVAKAFKDRFGVHIAEGYGLTETAPVTNVCLPDDFRSHSVGRAVPDLDQRIIDPETGSTLGPNTDGEVRMRGPNVMRGYYELAEATDAAFDENGYFKTGDMGRLDDDGHLYITGRIKEMMIVGGENVFPREIEEVLDAFPAVQASGVVGKQDDMRGELPVAFVELLEDEPYDEQALRDFCRERLASYKLPREIRVIDALPRNPTGKIMRRELKSIVDAE
ncbi:MAG: AMP-binding protein, partial [Planctomycetota bacterium]